MTPRDHLLHHLRDLDGFLLVVTGAGISLASGIPTFRGTDPGAVWKNDILEMATDHYFQRHPVESWRWYCTRFDRVVQALPNPAHHALAELERCHGDRGGEFLLVTQNTDTLHRKAGAQRLVEVHGRSDRVRCSSYGCRLGAPRGSLPRPGESLERFLASPCDELLPRCPECEGILRPHVLWFDEYYQDHDDYQWHRVNEAAERADLVLFVGTSFSVGVTELVLQGCGYRRVPIYAIDPGAHEAPYSFVRLLREPAEVLLPDVVTALRG
ncbi:MAG TPA: Sir2 family NAD-dependent protein deacetylase [Thermoanaerobaculia bacterium]|nr:Sir2 family NAD-dependent protein deacetylase [Thermoanaerobaculia bacterium]